MGIVSVNRMEPAAAEAEGGPSGEATPTFLSGESLTFPLVTGVGTAAITMYSAARSVEPTVGVVLAVSFVCGAIVTIWGLVDATEASGSQRGLGFGVYFKRTVIGLLNTVLLAAALWGTVSVSQAAYATG